MTDLSEGNLIAFFASGLISGSVALLFFFIRSYFSRLREEISELKGSFETIRRDLGETRESLVIARSELKAVWRTLDKRKDHEPRDYRD